METALIAITVVSLGVALTMGVVAWRASNEERRRAAARVAALSADAYGGDEPVAAPVPAPPVLTAAAPWRPAPSAQPASLDAFGGAAPAPEVAVHTGFLGADTPARESVSRQRGLAAAAAVLAVIVGAFAFARVGGDAEETPGTAAAPLELLSLRHEREGVMLSVAGLVRNPPAASGVEGVSAVVFLFDQQGTFVTSARAPIDFVKLTSGDESPFVVKVQAPQSVARYRVSFRTDDGTLPHVDRRGEAPVAAPVALSKP
jgi:hypothetical protein